MYENKFDQTLDEIGTLNGLNWNDDSKIRLLARFLGNRQYLLNEFEKFVQHEAEVEIGIFDEDDA